MNLVQIIRCNYLFGHYIHIYYIYGHITVEFSLIKKKYIYYNIMYNIIIQLCDRYSFISVINNFISVHCLVAKLGNKYILIGKYNKTQK